MTLNRFYTTILTVVAVAGFAHVAGAQYMYMDTNGNGVHDSGDRLNPNNASTAVDIYLSTNTNRNGTTAACNVDPPTPLGINSYSFNLVATGGTVTYGNYIPSPLFPNQGQQLNPGDGTYKNEFYGIPFNPAGLYRLGTLTITGTGGSPGISFVDLLPASQSFTQFGTQCPGFAFDQTYRLDGPSTRQFYGGPGDWFDTDGLPGSEAVVSAQIILENNGTVLDPRKGKSTKIGLEETVLPYTDLVPGSIRISTTFPNSGFVTECPADTKSFVIGDMDADGVPDLDVRFANKCLANLLNNVPDNSVQTIVITGEFASGSGTTPLHAERDLTIRVKHRNTPIPVVASPNPFNPETSISYTVRSDGPVTMRIYGIDGRLVRALKQGDATVAGTHEVTWNGRNDNGRPVPSGIYLVRITQTTGGTAESAALKITVAK